MHAVRAQSNSNTTHPMNRTRHIFLLADVRHHPPSDAKAFCVHVPSQLHTWGVLHTSGFRDRQRIHLRQLIMLIGAQYTAALTRDNTFLIATEPAGAKYEKAREWGVPVISEQWIEDVCSVWRLIPWTWPKYTVGRRATQPSGGTAVWMEAFDEASAAEPGDCEETQEIDGDCTSVRGGASDAALRQSSSMDLQRSTLAGRHSPRSASAEASGSRSGGVTKSKRKRQHDTSDGTHTEPREGAASSPATRLRKRLKDARPIGNVDAGGGDRAPIRYDAQPQRMLKYNRTSENGHYQT
eukprot:m.1209738 g.1209738  ORF g.1209738 m.1209738 type:complete len:296 (-) comp24591_c2_seq11:89-976(-)